MQNNVNYYNRSMIKLSDYIDTYQIIILMIKHCNHLNI